VPSARKNRQTHRFALPAARQETQYKITFPAFNATIQAIASDAGSAAGTNAVCAGFDELTRVTAKETIGPLLAPIWHRFPLPGLLTLIGTIGVILF
jgi:phage terminase large subunit-like protein